MSNLREGPESTKDGAAIKQGTCSAKNALTSLTILLKAGLVGNLRGLLSLLLYELRTRTMLLAEVCHWGKGDMHTFKVILQSIPLGTSTKGICSRIQAALLEKTVGKTSDQARLPPGLTRQRITIVFLQSRCLFLIARRLTEADALQVRNKYYSIVKSLVDYMGKRMPPKPYRQAAIHSLILQHWDTVHVRHVV